MPQPCAFLKQASITIHGNSKTNVASTHLGCYTYAVHIIQLGYQLDDVDSIQLGCKFSLEVYVLYLIWSIGSTECSHWGCQCPQVHEDFLKWGERHNITRGISEHIYMCGSPVYIKLPKYLTISAEKSCLWLSDLSNT